MQSRGMEGKVAVESGSKGGRPSGRTFKSQYDVPTNKNIWLISIMVSQREKSMCFLVVKELILLILKARLFMN